MMVKSRFDERGQPTRFQLACDWPGCHDATETLADHGAVIGRALATGWHFNMRVKHPTDPTARSMSGDWCPRCWTFLAAGWPAPPDPDEPP